MIKLKKFGSINRWYGNIYLNKNKFCFVCSCFFNLSFQLVIHCGVHNKTDKICLEQNAFNGNFRDADFSGEKLGSCHICLPNSGSECKQLCTSFNLKNIINETNTNNMKRSEHPGEYVDFSLLLKII